MTTGHSDEGLGRTLDGETRVDPPPSRSDDAIVGSRKAVLGRPGEGGVDGSAVGEASDSNSGGDFSALADPAGVPQLSNEAQSEGADTSPAVGAGQEGANGILVGLADDFGARWQSVQVGFVDAPKQAVENADQLIAEITERLLQQFRDQRAELEHTWSSGGEVSTEELRLALQKYRSFFERLLAA
jgi:hypothetical protein